jgi:molybdenum cofactor synthesis domain-containing protein
MIIKTINISKVKGTIKESVPSAIFTPYGIEGDAHAGDWHRQVSFLAYEEVAKFEARVKRPMLPGEFAENITTEGLDLRNVGLLDRFEIGDAVLEVTQLGKACHNKGCAVFNLVGDCIMPREGLFTRVVQGGSVHAGQEFHFVPRPLRLWVITLSDRASQGTYEDLSGPAIRSHLEKHFADTRWHPEYGYHLIPDDPAQLESLLIQAREAGADAVFTTGGTGVGPRDCTPEVVSRLADRPIPGVMEAIRMKFGADHPNALLSRSVCAMLGNTVVYALPGSVRAVTEYTQEILKTLEHLVKMVHGLGH